MKQKTLKSAISFQGIGLFTGASTSLRLIPAPENTGIVFKRVDLQATPSILAHVEAADAGMRCTRIGSQDKGIQTVEHLLSALHAFGVCNVFIELDGPEVPILDGSALFFSQKIIEVGCEEQGDRPVYHLQEPVFFSQGETHIVAIPSHELRMSYTLHYPESSLLSSQFYSVVINEHSFLQEIAPCRTFSLYEEIAPFIASGLVKGGSLDNAVIVKEGKVMNEGGLRFPDEMVRHKILDLLGDLALINRSFLAHVIAIRSGHRSNIAFAKEMLRKMENT